MCVRRRRAPAIQPGCGESGTEFRDRERYLCVCVCACAPSCVRGDRCPEEKERKAKLLLLLLPMLVLLLPPLIRRESWDPRLLHEKCAGKHARTHAHGTALQSAAVSGILPLSMREERRERERERYQATTRPSIAVKVCEGY